MTTLINTPARQAATPTAEAVAIVDFWREAGAAMWFAKDAEFDRRFRERFLTLYEAAARGEFAGWLATADGALALVLLLDQFPRNAFRGTPRMYATDALAREVTAAAIDAGHDRKVSGELQLFLYLPFGHSEDLADQERSVALNRRLGQPNLSHAERHRDIVRRFGRFPHRNPSTRGDMPADRSAGRRGLHASARYSGAITRPLSRPGGRLGTLTSRPLRGWPSQPIDVFILTMSISCLTARIGVDTRY